MNIDKILDIHSELTLHAEDGTVLKGRISEIADDSFLFTPKNNMDISPDEFVKVSDGYDACHAKVLEKVKNGLKLRIDSNINPEEEKRQNVRIYDKIYYTAKFIAHTSDKGTATSEALLRVRSNRLIIDSFLKGKYGFPGLDETPHTSEPPFNQALWEVNRKLDLLIHMFLADDFMPLMKAAPKDVNISASGMKFISETQYEEGDLIEINMILPMMPLLFIRVLGEVLRTKGLASFDDEKRDYAVAARFIQLDPESREDIIRYLFKRQREILRDMKH